MQNIGIIATGPADHVPDLAQYKDLIDIWIGADRGALTLMEQNIHVDYAVGDFDSINEKEKTMIKNYSNRIETYSAEKDETDLELALRKAFAVKPECIYLFGVTGGRLDHALINIQTLNTILHQNIRGIMIDQWNQLELLKPGTYTVSKNKQYPYQSFVAFTESVQGLTLTDFYYPLTGHDLTWGSTRCISNQLLAKEGTFSFETGRLLFIQSRDITSN
jgi:thiamine pyrophosphokinase